MFCYHSGAVRHEIRPITMRLERAVFQGICGEILALFQACVGNFDTHLLEHFILIAAALLLYILLS